MTSDRYYKWILNALSTCAESSNLYMEIKYSREDRFKPCLSLDGTIRDRTDTLCRHSLGYLRTIGGRFPKHCFPGPDELINTLYLLGVTATRGDSTPGLVMTSSLVMITSAGNAVMCGRVSVA